MFGRLGHPGFDRLDRSRGRHGIACGTIGPVIRYQEHERTAVRAFLIEESTVVWIAISVFRGLLMPLPSPYPHWLWPPTGSCCRPASPGSTSASPKFSTSGVRTACPIRDTHTKSGVEAPGVGKAVPY